MRIGLYHGYELTGSGSGEYTRYLARSLCEIGHEVHVICREPRPEAIPFVTRALRWLPTGGFEELFARENIEGSCILHQLPHGNVRPVFLTDKQRQGNVKAFTALSDRELREYHEQNENLLHPILSEYRLDVLHANHLIYQPVAALSACEASRTPLVIFPHGSAIEYTIKRDSRFERLAREAILQSAGLIIGNREMRDRILDIFEADREAILKKTEIVGVGVDTALFQPISRSNRMRSIESLLAKHRGGGKDPDLTRELHQRLDDGDIEATRDYWNRYDHSLPDETLPQRLKRISWDGRIILYVGALTVGKGIQSLIAAMPRVLIDHPTTHLLVVGAGSYREVLEALVHALSTGNRDLLLRLSDRGKDLDRNELAGPWEDIGSYLAKTPNLELVLESGSALADQVHFLGRLDHPLLRYLFPCADVALFPSIIPEAYPLVVMESLSSGVLPMVTYFSGFRDSVDALASHLDEALVELIKIPEAPDARIQSIADHLRQFFNMEHPERLGSRLHKIAAEQFDWKIRARQMTHAYRSLNHWATGFADSANGKMTR
jgi:glycosyltransferase involved in cell wall biosynthesis